MESEAILSWKEKLKNCVELSGQLELGERKIAAETWSAALRQIQAIWAANPHILQQNEPINSKNKWNSTKPITENDSKEYNDEDEDEEEEEEEEDVYEDVDDDDIVNDNQDSNNEDDIRDDNNSQDEIKFSSTKKFKSGDDKIKSVHLMISADPSVDLPNIKNYKKAAQTGGKLKITTYHCDKCPKTYRNPMGLYKHRLSHLKSLECQICNQHMSTRSALKAHMKTHSGEKPFECKECGSHFTTRGNLQRHINGHKGEKPWQCNQCGKSYTEKKSLKIHTRTHTGEKPYQCNICHKRFSQTGILTSHLLTHTNKFAHLCDFCGKSFRQRSQLATHRMRHQGTKEHACPHCVRKFTTKGDLDRHIRTHTGEKPFHCEICGFSFTRLQSLQEHKNRHFNIKPYICKICKKGFHEVAACSRHVKSNHAYNFQSETTPPSHYILKLTNEQAHQIVNGELDLSEIVIKDGFLQAELVMDSTKASSQCFPDSDSRDALEPAESKSQLSVEIVENIVEEGSVGDHIFVIRSSEPNSDETKLITVGTSDHVADIIQQHENLSSSDGYTCESCGSFLKNIEDIDAHSCQVGIHHVEQEEEDDGEDDDGPREIISRWLTVPGSTDAEAGGGGEVATAVGGEGVGSLQCVVETSEGLECGLGHAVTISQDGSITSVPLSQLAPIQLQLQDDYMVVLSEGSEEQPQPTQRDLAQRMEPDALVNNTEDSAARITLVTSAQLSTIRSLQQ